MKTIHLTYALFLLLSLVSCSDKDNNTRGVIPEAQQDSLEKAKGVEDTLKQATRERDAKLENH